MSRWGTGRWVLTAALALAVLWGAYYLAFAAGSQKPDETGAREDTVTQSGTSPARRTGDEPVTDQRGGENEAP